MNSFASGFIAGNIVMFVVGTVWAATQFWQIYEKSQEKDKHIFDLEQEVVHANDGKVAVEWSKQSGVKLKTKYKLWEDNLYVPGSDTVIIDDQKDY